MGLLFPAGTTATLADLPSGSPSGITYLKAISENDIEAKMGNIQGLGDTAVKDYPSGVLDPGEVEVTVFLDDTAPVSNFYTLIKTKQATPTKVSLAVNLPGSFDNTTALVGPFQGYIKNVSSPALEVGDEALSFKFKIRVSAG